MSEAIARPANFCPTPIAPSDLIFRHYAGQIKEEHGIDVFRVKEAMEADEWTLRRLLDKFRNDKTFVDESILDEVWQEFLRAKGILSNEGQQAKDEYSLAKARTTKSDLQKGGLADAARFGFCKRTGCTSRKVKRLLVRGFCPVCRGVAVISATAEKLDVTHVKPHRETKRETAEERAKKVLAAKEQHPDATVREIAERTKIPRSTVSDVLKNYSVKPKLENTDAIKQFLQERSEQQPRLRRAALEYLKHRVNGAEPAAGDRIQTYVIGETGQDWGQKVADTGQTVAPCPRCRRAVIPDFHFDWRGRCLSTEKAVTDVGSIVARISAVPLA